jgi:hypothetical protein
MASEAIYEAGSLSCIESPSLLLGHMNRNRKIETHICLSSYYISLCLVFYLTFCEILVKVLAKYSLGKLDIMQTLQIPYKLYGFSTT